MLAEYLPEKVQRKLLSSTFIFPETHSIKNDEPIILCNLETLNFDRVLEEIKKNPEINAISDNLTSTVILMKTVKDELLLDRYDQIRICCGGLCVVCIKLENNNGRSAYFELHDFQRRIKQYWECTKTPWVTALIAGLIVVSVAFIILRVIDKIF